MYMTFEPWSSKATSLLQIYFLKKANPLGLSVESVGKLKYRITSFVDTSETHASNLTPEEVTSYLRGYEAGQRHLRESCR